MFNKLRLRLVFVNLSVIAVLFLLLIAGTYFFVQNRMAKEAEHIAIRVADDLISCKFTDLPIPHEHDQNQPGGAPTPGPWRGIIMFFAKVDSLSNVIQVSSTAPLPPEEILTLAEESCNTGKSKGMLLHNTNEYIYHIVPIPDNQGSYVIFENFQHQRNLLHSLVIGLSVTGFICSILSMFGSFFMANRAMEPIQKAWQQQKDFLADASHELRTPLAVIQTNLELVRDNKDETVQSQGHWLDNIQEETASMTRLVDSLLLLARSDSNQALLKYEQLVLDETVTAMVELFRTIAVANGVELISEVQSAVHYYGDKSKLRQVVDILLDNAIRHTPAGGKVKVTLENKYNDIVLKVIDTGEGICPDDIENIFRRFYQSDAARAQGGAGLGLSIAKCIVEEHGGTIGVKSTYGEGTKFTIKLPKKV